MNNMIVSPDQLLNNLDNIKVEDEIIHEGNLHKIRKCIIIPTGQAAIYKTANQNIQNGLVSLIQEYNILVRCSHPSIQNLIGFYQSENEDECALITPFYIQGNLDQFLQIKSNDLSPTTKYIITLGIASGLKYLHKNGISHQNLRPEKILLTDLNRPKLIHFGFPPVFNDQITDRKNYFLYQAPEFLPNDAYDQKSDVYSFGLIINEIYSGNKIFQDKSYDEMMNIKRNGNITIDKSIPKFLKDILLKCIKPNPSERPTFKEIYQKLRSNCYKIQNDTLISSYLKDLSFGSKRKNTFRIPHQILKLPSDEFPWNMETPSPINWDEFNKIFPTESEEKALLIMTFGGTQTGKSTFLRTITKNQAYYSGSGISTTTLGLLIDGPYKKNDLVDLIFDDEYKEKFDNLSISEDTLIYFIDSQGIGDESYSDNYCIVLDRIHSIFCSVATLCITITDINTPFEVIQKVLKIVRRAQFSHLNQIFLLIKGYENFDKLDDMSFESLQAFHSKFIEDYWKQYKSTSKYYAYEFLYPLPLGNYRSNYENYLYSTWFILNYIFSNVKEESIEPISETRRQLEILQSGLFGTGYKMIYDDIIENSNEKVTGIIDSFPDSQKTTAEVIKLCCSCCYYLAEKLSYYLGLPQQGQSNADEISNFIEQLIFVLYRIIFPYFFGNFNIPLADYSQYLYEMSRDVNSYVKVNFGNWQRSMKIGKIYSKIATPVLITSTALIYTSGYIPVVGWIVEGICSTINISAFIYERVSKKMREKIKKEFTPTIFPFIWNRSMIKYKKTDYKLDAIKQIGSDKDQLIVFYEQNGNDSTLLFRSLTGFDVNFKNEERFGQVFYNVPIKEMMARYKRYKKVHSSKLENKRVNILYIKGCSQGEIISLCHVHKTHPIFVSSILSEQMLTISPEEGNLFHLFCLADNIYNEFMVTRPMYSKCMKSSYIDIIKNSIGMKYGEILPVNSKNFNLNEAGPISHALIRYGCKFILQDVSFDKKDDQE